MRVLLSVTAALVLLTAVPVTAAPGGATPTWRAKECRYRLLVKQRPPAFTTQEVKLTIACAVRHWPVEGGYPKALAVAECESSLYPHAVSPTGEYRGVFQMGSGEFATWALPRWNVPHDVFNARANVIAAIRMAHNVGWGPWSCA